MALWIRMRIGNPDPESGSRAKKMKKNKYFLVDFIYFYNGKVGIKIVQTANILTFFVDF
jgi:hypothetical protein